MNPTGTEVFDDSALRSTPLSDEDLVLAWDMSTFTAGGVLFDFSGGNHPGVFVTAEALEGGKSTVSFDESNIATRLSAANFSDPTAVVREAAIDEAGNWVGAQYIYYNTSDNTFWLTYRWRNTIDNGHALSIEKSTDATSFTQVNNMTDDDLGVISIEQSSLYFDESADRWRIFFAGNNATGDWDTYTLDPVGDPANFDPTTASIVLNGTGELGAFDERGAKGAKVVLHNGVHYLFYAGQDSDGNFVGSGVATSTDGATFTRWTGNPCQPQPPGPCAEGNMFLFVLDTNDTADDRLLIGARNGAPPGADDPWEWWVWYDVLQNDPINVTATYGNWGDMPCQRWTDGVIVDGFAYIYYEQTVDDNEDGTCDVSNESHDIWLKKVEIGVLSPKLAPSQFNLGVRLENPTRQEYITTPHTSLLDMTNSSVTLVWWGTFHESGRLQWIMGKQFAFSQAYGFRLDSTDEVEVVTRNAAANPVVQTGFTITAGVQYAFGVTWTDDGADTTVRFYANGILEHTAAGNIRIGDVGEPFRIGRVGNSDTNTWANITTDEALVFRGAQPDNVMQELTTVQSKVVIGGGSEIVESRVNVVFLVLPYAAVALGMGYVGYLLIQGFREAWDQ